MGDGVGLKNFFALFCTLFSKLLSDSRFYSSSKHLWKSVINSMQRQQTHCRIVVSTAVLNIYGRV